MSAKKQATLRQVRSTTHLPELIGTASEISAARRIQEQAYVAFAAVEDWLANQLDAWMVANPECLPLLERGELTVGTCWVFNSSLQALMLEAETCLSNTDARWWLDHAPPVAVGIRLLDGERKMVISPSRSYRTVPR